MTPSMKLARLRALNFCRATFWKFPNLVMTLFAMITFMLLLAIQVRQDCAILLLSYTEKFLTFNPFVVRQQIGLTPQVFNLASTCRRMEILATEVMHLVLDSTTDVYVSDSSGMNQVVPCDSEYDVCVCHRY